MEEGGEKSCASVKISSLLSSPEQVFHTANINAYVVMPNYFKQILILLLIHIHILNQQLSGRRAAPA